MLLFRDATAFNQNIGSWEVTNVAFIRSMFRGATSFNQDVGLWNVSRLTDMSFMFCGALCFNQEIGPWYESNVTNMEKMLFRATAVNQGIRFWDISRVTEKIHMFGATSLKRLIFFPKHGAIMVITKMSFAALLIFRTWLGSVVLYRFPTKMVHNLIISSRNRGESPLYSTYNMKDGLRVITKVRITTVHPHTF
jgi:hypothetical protein